MHRVACSSGFWAPRSIEETRDHLDDPPVEKHLLFPVYEPTNAPIATGRLQQLASVGPHRTPLCAFCFPPSPYLFFFLFSFIVYRRVRSQGFDGPRGDFPGRRGPTEGASHTRLGHEPRPSDLLKISIALAPLALPHEHDVRPKQAHRRRHYSHHCIRSFLLFFSLAFLPLSLLQER